MPITSDQARQELARRELARRQIQPQSEGENSGLSKFLVGSNPVSALATLPFAAAKYAKESPPGGLEAAGMVGGGFLGAEAGIPNVGAGIGGAIGKGLELARQDSGEPITKQSIAGTTGDLALTGVRDYAGSLLFNKAVQAGGKFLPPIGRGFKRLFSTKAAVNLAEQTQEALSRAKTVSNKAFGAQLQFLKAMNPKATISVTEEAAALAKSTTNPRTLALIEAAERNSGTNILSEIMTNPAKASSLTLEEAQQAKEAINSVPGFMSKLKNPAGANFDVTEKPLVDFAVKLKAATNEAFPGKEALDELHFSRKSQERLLKPLTNPRNYTVGGTPRLSSKPFQSTPPQVKEAYKAIIPKQIRVEHSGVRTAKNIGTLFALEELGKRYLPPFLSRAIFNSQE